MMILLNFTSDYFTDMTNFFDVSGYYTPDGDAGCAPVIKNEENLK